MQKEYNIIDGVLVLNKPTGMNSMRAVKTAQRLLNAKKAGHLGTLDPLASGVLLVAVGKGTKLFEKHLKARKKYKAIFKFGVQSETFDSEGPITQIQDVNITEKQVKEVLPGFVGQISQMPPKFSAKKINGKKAYQLAREGKEVVLKPKEITIHSLQYVRKVEENTFEFDIDCSAGTYIRSIARDLASALGTFGTMVGLIRLSSGEYTIEDSVTLEEITESSVKKLENY